MFLKEGLVMNNIKRFREKRNLSQQELAERIGTNRSAVSQYEIGSINLSYEAACMIGHALSVDPIILAGTDVLKKGFQDENLFALITVILDAKFDEIVIDGNSSEEDLMRFYLLAYLFEYKLSKEDMREILNFVKFKVDQNKPLKSFYGLDNIESAINRIKESA